VRDLTQGGWRLERTKIKSMAEDIETAIVSVDREKAVLVLQILDNDLYFGAGEEGEAKAPYKSFDKKYYIEGKLAVATEEMLKDRFIDAMPIFRAGRELPTVLVGPLPRYAMAKCCDNEAHVTNFGICHQP